MNILGKLREKRTQLIADAGKILEAAEVDERDLTSEEQTAFDDLHVEAKALQERIERLEQQGAIEAQLQETAPMPAPIARDRPPAPTTEATFGQPPTTVQPTGIPAEPKKPLWAGVGEFLNAVADAEDPSRPNDPRLLIEAAATGASEGSPSGGGFLVGTDMASGLLQRTYEIGAITSRVRNLPISPTSNGAKFNGVDETSRAHGSRNGGIRGYWVAEATEKTASKPKFRQVELDLKEVAALFYATDRVLQDTMLLESLVNAAVPEELNFLLEDAIFEGTGAGQPLGIMKSPCLITVPKETGQLAATIVAENIVKMWARLWAKSQPNSVWLVNQDVFPQLYLMGITVGTGGSPIYQPPGGLSGSPYSTLMGRPIIPVEYSETLGTTGDIMLADLSQYVTISKGGIQSAMSIHVRFIYDESVFRWILRTDGQPTWNSALTPFKGTNTVSPFVVLATRA